MLSIFRAITERLKALFATSAALELESEFLARDAERKAELLRQAARYQEEGLHGIAQHLRQQAEALSLQQPLHGILPTVTHLQATLPERKAASPRLRLFPPVASDEEETPISLPLPIGRKERSND